MILLSLLCLSAAAADLPYVGITHVAFRVSGVARSREFYGKTLGFEEPFEFNDYGKTGVAFVKVNDWQYIELYPGLSPSETMRFMHIAVETKEIDKMHQRLPAQRLNPSPVSKGRAGNLLFSVKDPDGQVVEFLEYLPGSLHVITLEGTGGAKDFHDPDGTRIRITAAPAGPLDRP